ncbi:dead end protein 1 isoform X1 [Corythoichthys intestinalis]|uniref:dead end protein 1 isoform X1 n=1 Tax=Corythoichthys intestinalis TaxID=161448 RepID=UPI0025A593EF|nr:dead end protein 1 isoform X1 [Corythoichthys intestinalis]
MHKRPNAMENNQLQAPNTERLQALQQWLQTTNTKLTQVNGQRKYGGPPDGWNGPDPGSNCEVFINRIPRNTYEDLLIPLFSSVGPLWEFRLMMNFSGQNRGFAYAKYGSSEVAKKAIHMLHGHMLEPGVHLLVYHSTEKKQLCIAELPVFTQEDQLLQVLRRIAEGVETLCLKAQPQRETVLAVIDFSSHHAASMAKKMLVEAFRKLYGLRISVKWYSQMQPRWDEMLFRPNNSLGLGQLPSLRHPVPTPANFCRAVRVPYAPNPHAWPVTSAASSLGNICAAIGIGAPQFEFNLNHICREGYLYFSFKVCIPGTGMVFQGQLGLLPGPTEAATMEKVQELAAQHVLRSLNPE